jgi:hypothetical protein
MELSGHGFWSRCELDASDCGVELRYVVLRPNLKIALQRAQARSGGALREAVPIRFLHDQFSDLGPLQRHVIDTSNQSATESIVAVREALSDDRFLVL